MSVKRRLEAVWKQYPDPRVWYWTRWFFGNRERRFTNMGSSRRWIELNGPNYIEAAVKKRDRSGKFSKTWTLLDLFPYTDSGLVRADERAKATGDVHAHLEAFTDSPTIDWEAIHRNGYRDVRAQSSQMFWRVQGWMIEARWDSISPEYAKLVPWLARNINRYLKKPHLAVEEGLRPLMKDAGLASNADPDVALKSKTFRGTLTGVNIRMDNGVASSGMDWDARTFAFLCLIGLVDLHYIKDWIEFDANHPQESGRPDMNDYDFVEAMAEARKSHDYMQELARTKRFGPAKLGKEVIQIEDAGGDVWSLVHLDSREAYKEESEKMGHCIGLSTGYWKQAKAGTMKAFSLRLGGKSYVTLNLEDTNPHGFPGGSGNSWHVEQVKLYGNSLIGEDWIHHRYDDGTVVEMHPLSETRESGDEEPVTDYRTLCALVDEVVAFLGVDMNHYANHVPGDLEWCAEDAMDEFGEDFFRGSGLDPEDRALEDDDYDWED